MASAKVKEARRITAEIVDAVNRYNRIILDPDFVETVTRPDVQAAIRANGSPIGIQTLFCWTRPQFGQGGGRQPQDVVVEYTADGPVIRN